MAMPSSLQQDLMIPFYADMQCDFLGLDSVEHCFDPTHFRNFGEITYLYNEIGYRTRSVQEMGGREILAIGDSFTLGLGVNTEHRWTEYLESILGYPVLNFSLNGASNDWISRRTQDLLRWFDPPAILIQWSFSHRRERARPDWFDDERTECNARYSDEENLQNWIDNFSKIHHDRIIHSAVPNWHIGFDYQSWPVIPPFCMLDRARDGFHYGPKTNRAIAETFTSLLAAGSHLSL